ncbi:MAG: prolipoprotein diacylglyceryl transferase [Spirochaetales bacterium]|nr:prolipoprotein diacylglyceryl transferase [Spirochaetales bacterium]
MQAFIYFPNWIKPEIIPGFPVRWYGLMYLVAFGITYFLVIRQLKKDKPGIEEDDLLNCFFWAIIGLLIGARIFATTIYDPTHYYITRPWLIFWPFRDGQFTGLQGMSYHGGVVGAVVSTMIYCRIRKLSWFKVADLIVAGLPLGYTFGRLGNFINGELWGRVTTKPWGIVFPHAPKFSVAGEWVRDVVHRVGMELPSAGLINLPRHPSQLYEALLEGVILWLFLWFIVKPRKKTDGTMISFYLIGYGLVRFFIEYFREPDADMGFPLQFADAGPTPALFSSFFNFSTGQILCALMIIGGIALYQFSKRRAFAPPSEKESGSAGKSIRRRRKRIK